MELTLVQNADVIHLPESPGSRPSFGRRYSPTLRGCKFRSLKRGLFSNLEDWKWSSYRHYAFREIGIVEIESEWTARGWGQKALGVVPRIFLRPGSCPKPGRKPGAPGEPRDRRRPLARGGGGGDEQTFPLQENDSGLTPADYSFVKPL